jgi:hypothetical protein
MIVDCHAFVQVLSQLFSDAVNQAIDQLLMVLKFSGCVILHLHLFILLTNNNTSIQKQTNKIIHKIVSNGKFSEAKACIREFSSTR